MGMYTELHFNAELRKDTPEEVLAVLRFMVGESDTAPAPLPEHPLFAKGRWRFMLNCDSYYFDAPTHSVLDHDEDYGFYVISVRCNLKNYESEIEAFIDWIDPWLAKDPGDFLGFYRYEETEQPTLIFKRPPSKEDG